MKHVSCYIELTTQRCQDGGVIDSGVIDSGVIDSGVIDSGPAVGICSPWPDQVTQNWTSVWVRLQTMDFLKFPLKELIKAC